MKITLCIIYYLKDISLFSAFICVLKTLLPIPFKNRKGLIAIYAIVTAVIDTVGILNPEDYLSQQYEILDFISFLLCVFSAFFLLRKPPAAKTIATAIIFVSTIDVLWSFVRSFVKTENSSLFAVIAECLFSIVLTSAITSAYAFLMRKRLISTVSCAANKFPASVIFTLFIFELACYYNEFGLNEIVFRIIFSVSACMVISCLIYLFLNIQKLISRQDEILGRLSEQLAFADDVRKSDDELRAFRHDIKNHIIVLQSLFSKGEYERASSYFDCICNDVEPFVNRFSTGNSVADSLLTVKSEFFRIDFDGIIPENFIPDEDLCIILGNLLDNAIEGCRNSEEKQSDCIISVSAWVRNSNLVIKISNPTKDFFETKKVFKKFSTTKKDKKNHGYGLANIRKSVTDNNGSLELSSEKGIFTASVILKGE